MSMISGIVKRSAKGRPRRNPLAVAAVCDAKTARAYADFVGVLELAAMPPMAFHNLCFPATVRVLSESAVPVRLLGLVHESLVWQLYEPLEVDAPVTAHALVTNTERRAGGIALTVTSVVSAGNTVHYAEQAVYFSRRPLPGPDVEAPHPLLPADWQALPAPNLREEFGVNDAGTLDIGQRAASAWLRLTPNAGRRWAKISGDANPIHVSNAAARPFGFKSAIIHGSAIEAWVHAVSGIDGTAAASGTTRFRAPIRIPNEIELVRLEESACSVESACAVVESRSGRDMVHLRIFAGQSAADELATVSADGSAVQSMDYARIVIPRVDGRASSTALGRAVFGAVAKAVETSAREKQLGGQASGDGTATREEIGALAAEAVSAVADARNWRAQYREPVRLISALDDPPRGPLAAQAGLDYLAENVARADGTKLRDIRPATNVPLGLRVVGRLTPRRELAIPYQGESVQGGALDNQLSRWTAAGAMTVTAAGRIREVASNPDWLNLTGVTFGVLGVGAELAPTRFLLDLGAHVAGVIRPDSQRRQTLIDDAHKLSGTLDLSPRVASDIVSQTDAVAGWLLGRRPHVVVDTLYAPGVDFLVLELGADVIMRAVAENSEAMLAWYGTPTDAYPLGERCERAGGIAHRNAESSFPRRLAKSLATFHAAPAIRGGIFNGIVDFQGPNYILAKRVGRWRATVLAAGGHHVSFNVAPMASTESVLISRALEATYRGLDRLGLETFAPETAAALMGALLVWDYRNRRQATVDFLTESGVPSGLWSQDIEPQELMKRAAVLGSGAFLR